MKDFYEAFYWNFVEKVCEANKEFDRIKDKDINKECIEAYKNKINWLTNLHEDFIQKFTE